MMWRKFFIFYPNRAVDEWNEVSEDKKKIQSVKMLRKLPDGKERLRDGTPSLKNSLSVIT